MRRTLLRSKIHRVTVTGADLHYEGSVSMDPELIRAAGLFEFERVDIYNCTNGERFSTYVIVGGPGEVCLNGAAARKAQPGDLVIIANYADFEAAECANHRPVLVFVDSENGIRSVKRPQVRTFDGGRLGEEDEPLPLIV